MNFSPTEDKPRRVVARKSRWFARIILLTPFAIFAYFLILILAYRIVDPPLSTLMAGYIVSGNTINQKWIPIENMSRHLPLAVIVSEDSRYCQHHGVDWLAIEKSWSEESDISEIRGASTIPMQTMKNLFLWPGRNVLRKSLEIPLAYGSSFVWAKKRMIEIYLNIVEWGPGVFGIEAASQFHFKKRASQLTRHESALLAATLPNPRVRRAGEPGPKLRRLANLVQKRMAAGASFGACIR